MKNNWYKNKGIVTKDSYFVLPGELEAYKAIDVIKKGKAFKNWKIIYIKNGLEITIPFMKAMPVTIK